MAVKTYSYAKDQNIKLSAHFRVGEFRSFSSGMGKLTTDVIKLDDNLVPTLERLFDYLACSKIIISSGYRSPDFEKYLGGNPTTGQHCKGKAADIICYGQDGKKIDPKTVCCAGQALGVTGIGYMAGGTHIDVRAKKSWFDETKGNKVVSDWYSYFGIKKPTQQKPTETPKSGVTTLKPGTWNVRNAPSLGASVNRVVKGVQSVTYVDIVPETNPQKYGERNFYKLRDGTYLSVKACK